MIILDSKSMNLFVVTKRRDELYRVNIRFAEHVHEFRLGAYKIKKIEQIKLLMAPEWDKK